MVRETRHLWVGNLPDNIREERIREHFKRYGRVQSVKVLARGASAGGAGGAGALEGGTCAAVAFMDIKSAAKAHNSEKLLDERAYTTEYYEPAAIPSTASAGSSPASSGSVSSARLVNAAEESISVAAAVGCAALAGGAAAAAAGAAAGSLPTWRGTNDSADRADYRRGGTPAYCAPPHYRRGYPAHAAAGSPHDRPHRRRFTGESSAGSTPGAGEAGSGSGGGGTRRRRRSGSGAGSSRSSSSSPEPSSDSGASTPTAPGAPAHRTHSSSAQWSSNSGRPLAICVRNLPARSSDSSLKDGLYHEYKKHGKVAWVKVVGANSDRYAVVRFKKPSDVEKALEVSQDKLFFGCKISVAPHQGSGAELEEGEPARPYETDLDENHPKATRTLFIGNLEKEVTLQQLRDKFKHFGRIVEIDVKKASGGAGYAFCQYASISSVVDAIRAMDGEHVGGSRVKLGFGKSMATACVWIDGLTELTEKQVLGVVSRCGAATSVCVDRSAGSALVHFEQAAAAAAALRELRRVAAALTPPASAPSAGLTPPDAEPRRLTVDFASRDCQDAFYETLEKHGGGAAGTGSTSERLSAERTSRYARHDSLSRYDVAAGPAACRSRTASFSRSSSRTPRYALPDHYDEFPADRRYRLYDELGSSSPAELDGAAVLEEARSLQSVVVASPRRRNNRHHRRRSRDSTPDELKVRKEHRRSGSGRTSGDSRHRSPSGSRRRRTSEAERRRHRRRRDESAAESRAGTPLRDELPEGPAPADPRRPPVHRDRVVITLQLPKFAEPYLARAAPSVGPAAPATAPASPPRAPSASSSSGGSAPHSPSLEERIRSLDERYEKWSGSRAAAAESAERGRARHRLLDIDINEVKPSDVARSLLAKRSVFDEDSERLEGSAALDKRATSPSASGPRAPRAVTRALQYPFPTHPPLTAPLATDLPSVDSDDRLFASGAPLACLQRDTRQLTIDSVKSEYKKSFVECSESSADKDILRIVADSSDSSSTRTDIPRPNRTDLLSVGDKHLKPAEQVEFKPQVQTLDPGILSRSSSIEKSHPDPLDKKRLEKTDNDTTNRDRDPRREVEKLRNERGEDNTPKKQLECDSELEVIHKIPKREQSTEEKMNSDIREQLKKDVMENARSPQEADQHGDGKKQVEFAANVCQQTDYQNMPLSQGQKREQVVLETESINIQAKEITPTVIEDKSQGDSPSGKDKVEFNCSKANSECQDELDSSSIQQESSESLTKEKADHEKTENQTKDKERAEKECLEKQRVEREVMEKERVERESIEKETIKKEKNIQKLKREESEKEKQRSEIENSKKEKEKLKDDYENNKHLERDKLDKEKFDRDGLEKENLKHEREAERSEKEKQNKENDRHEEKHHRHDTKKERCERDKRKDDSTENLDTFNHVSKSRKEDKHKHDRHRKEHNESKRESKKEKEGSESKSRDVSRKSSRDESSRDMQRKDSSDSTTSRISHDSTKYKDIESSDLKDKDNAKQSGRHKHSLHDHSNHKPKSDKEPSPRNSENRKHDGEKNSHEKSKDSAKSHQDQNTKERPDNHIEKQRHYSLDSQNVDSKRKDRLTSSSSLPSNIGQKRRMSSQDVLDCIIEESKKAKIEQKIHERRDSKDIKGVEKSKAPKFNKGHFAKLLESKIKDDKKNQVKTPDEKIDDWQDTKVHENKIHSDKTKSGKKSPKSLFDDSSTSPTESKTECDIKQEAVSPRGIEFLATLELRSSEEDEKQRAMKKEMKEKKRIQQLQQIQELQNMQQDAMQQCDTNKLKDDKKIKNDERKKDAAREKRMSTERKSREDKPENKKRSQKPGQSSDTSDSDEPKKHSIFDIVDDGPTYISMYDKVKARSCKNMQKQEEEKRQEKIKAKFSQLKQSRAKREEKKRSTSWDEDSDSDQERKKYSNKYSVGSSSEDDRNARSAHQEQLHFNNFERLSKIEKYYNDSNNEDDSINKLSRKNSRSRIISDTSDDDSMKKNIQIRNYIDVKKEVFSDTEMPASDYIMKKNKDIKQEPYSNSIKDQLEDSYKSSMNNLFEDNLDDKKALKKLLANDNNHIRATENFTKCLQMTRTCNDFSSEGELSNKLSGTEIRKKHKKKQKKQKSSLSEDDTKSTDYSEQSPLLSGEVKHRRNSEKAHRHNRKERRKEKLRDSIDSEEYQEKTKSKKGKKCLDIGFESKVDSSNNIRRDEKMENIFGPLSDDSDGVPTSSNSKHNFNDIDLPTAMSNDKFNFIGKNIDDFMTKDKEREESKRRKEKKRKEKRYISRDDENSLDVDAAGKAIEASLFEDSVPENDNQNTNVDSLNNKSEQDVFRFTDCDNNLESTLTNAALKEVDKARREAKEKKKKKKKNKEDRQSRHYHHEKSETSERYIKDSSSPPDNLPVKEVTQEEKKNNSEDIKLALQSPSLPRLTDSPPPLFGKSEIRSQSNEHATDHSHDITVVAKTDMLENQKTIKLYSVTDHQTSLESTMQPPKSTDERKILQFIAGSGDKSDENLSEKAVKSISEFEMPNDNEKLLEDTSNKPEDKQEEKPRAVISQEETEDAVAALLGESFGANNGSYTSCFDDVEDGSSAQAAGTTMESENILEEDAEEMRQAVQNLNASELEIKPDTPLSENDLQIDTDTEEQDDSQQETPVKVQMPVSASLPTAVIENKVKITESVLNPVPANPIPAKNKVNKDLNKSLPFLTYGTTASVKSDQTRDQNISPTKRDVFHQITSTATPVISTTWTLSGNKLREQHLINVHTNNFGNRDEQPSQLTANIIQLKPQISPNLPTSTQPRAVIGTQARMNHPFILNHMIRPGHVPSLQPPTIKIPDHHVMYQKQGVVISPRMINDARLQSPKSSPHSDMSSPRMTIISPTEPSMGLPSPTTLQQRSPGQVTVVRMQQPQLSPIQTMHLSHGTPCRTMVSPSRPNSVLVQAQTAPININRLPVTPVLAPLPKPINPGNVLQQTKNITVNTNSAILQQKIITEMRKTDTRAVPDLSDNSKFIISPSNLQPTTNPTVMAQNRLIMQNASLHMANKILFNNAGHLSDKRDSTHIPFKAEIPKIEPPNKVQYGAAPIIHIATVNQPASTVHNTHKPVISIGQEQFIATRPHVSNIIHTVNSQRLLTTVAMTSVIQGDPSKPQPSSVLSMSPIRSPTVLTRFDKPANALVTSSALSNVVMTPAMVKTISSQNNYVQDKRNSDPRATHLAYSSSEQHEQRPLIPQKMEDRPVQHTVIGTKFVINTQKEMINIAPKFPTPPADIKCGTDFEELLKDNVSEIKVAKDLNPNVEVKTGIVDSLPLSSKVETTNDDNKTVTQRTDDPKAILTEMPQAEGKADLRIKNEESDGWSAKEVNIESVIKKVDDLCNSQDTQEKLSEGPHAEVKKIGEITHVNNGPSESKQDVPLVFTNDDSKCISVINKRGGRNARGKKADKQPDRVQTRQISKPQRGSASSKRGRGGRAKVDKKFKTATTGGPPALSGDVYDFHDDSGDESQSSAQNKNESRPRLILTIKSPLTTTTSNIAQTTNITVVATAPSITLKEQPAGDKSAPQLTTNKDEKNEDFLSPAPNTRKSRRLQEKDGHRNTVDDVIDDVVKNATVQSKGAAAKDGSGRRNTRQTFTKSNTQDKAGSDVRKLPRGGKRTRNRSSSDTSVDSSDERSSRKDDLAAPESKIPKLAENSSSPEKLESENGAVMNKDVDAAVSTAVVAPAPVNLQIAAATPIMKPPKKMISEISAKLGSSFDAVPLNAIAPAEKPLEAEAAGMPAVRPQVEKVLPGEAKIAHGVWRQSETSGFVVEPPPLGRGAVPGADEADLRVQSPALPHRPPPLMHRQDRNTPILIRSGEREALEGCRASPAAAGAVGGVGPGGAAPHRASFDPSLPRGAHHPPPPPPPALPSHPPHARKHVAVVGPQSSRVTHAALPSGSPQGSITGDTMYPHFSHPHYQVYQQHFRATQDIRATPSPYTRSPREAEGSEAPTPPLELRRPPPSARVPRPAHSPSPADRLISGRGSPPPAHGGAGVSRLPSALPPLGPVGPPHASQVPREADSLQMLLRRYPVMWQGLLALKNDGAAVQMHFVHGNPGVAGHTLPRHVDGSTPPLRIAQRMRLEPVQLEAVHRKMQMENEHCMLLALPCGRDHMDVLQQSTNLTAGFITYLQRKQAAGIVNVAPPGHHQAMYTVHIFPSCEFANENLNRIAPDLLHRVADIAHLLIVIATV